MYFSEFLRAYFLFDIDILIFVIKYFVFSLLSFLINYLISISYPISIVYILIIEINNFDIEYQMVINLIENKKV